MRLVKVQVLLSGINTYHKFNILINFQKKVGMGVFLGI